MSKPPKRLTRKAISITIDPTILDMIDKRGANRSETINQDLARYYLITEGKEELTPAERRRLKSLTIMGDFQRNESPQ